MKEKYEFKKCRKILTFLQCFFFFFFFVQKIPILNCFGVELFLIVNRLSIFAAHFRTIYA